MARDNDNPRQARDPLEDLLSAELKNHYRIENVAPHSVTLPPHLRCGLRDRQGRRGQRSRREPRSSVRGRGMTRPLLAGLAAAAVIAVVGIGVARYADEDRGDTIAADPNTSSGTATAPGTGSSQLSLAQVARLTGYKIQAASTGPSGASGLTERAVLAVVPDAAYAIGPARVGFPSEGVAGSLRYEWQVVWVVATRTKQVPWTQQSTAGQVGSGRSQTGFAGSFTIAFIDASSGQMVQEKRVALHG